ncbi:MAG TPA: DUF5715 family protein [Gemmatimonadaceae bacterium]|nr:DUF5715 family protein [Gemmatimonadaceae bacterium]
MGAQREVAIEQDFTFLSTKRDVARFVSLGLLVPVPGSASYSLAGVSHRYARPAVRLFVERLADQYKAACGEKLVVTSLTRPESEQPRNASDESVHPTGMAVDLRISRDKRCRAWLENTLLSMERNGVIEATREKHPAHYHVAVFPVRYSDYVEAKTGAASSINDR